MFAPGVKTETVSPAELYDVVCGASSQDPTKVQASAKRLKEMLEMAGTYDGLHEIAAQRSVPLPVRQQSIIQFKNAALNHWRSRKLLTDDQRARIRTRCLTFLDEGDETIAECNEVIVAKIARQDFPHIWSSLLVDIMGVIDTNLQSRYISHTVDPHSTLMLRRSLKVLNEILKEFMNLKMLTGVKTMGGIVDQLHAVLYNYYSKLASAFSGLNPSTISEQRTTEDLFFAHIVFKCLVKMATWLWNRTDQTDEMKSWFVELFQSSAIQLKTLSELRINLVLALHSSSLPIDANAMRSIDQLTRHVRLFGKFFRRLQQLAVSRFVGLPTCDDLVLYYWSKVVQATNGSPKLVVDSNDAVFPVRFLVQAMVLFKESLAQWTPFSKRGEKNINVLSQQYVEDSVKLLVTRFIPLNPSDLETWMADPEEWVNGEDKESELWEFELRPCGERVLMTLSQQYRQYVTPLLETTFKQIIAQPTVDLPSIIQKEAVYCAIGRCAPRLKDVIPFNQWLEHTLIAEAQETNPNYPIIKRRIAWLIGKWIGDSCSSPNNPKIWEVLVHLLRDRGPGTDAVVRLTAAAALRECVDTVDFDAGIFAPFLASAVTEVVRVLADADTLESKRRISKCLNIVIEQAGSRIVPLIRIITEPLPKLWTDADQDYLLKASILTTMTKLIESAKEQSTSLCRIVVPLIRESLSPGVIKFLDDDALILWQAALCNTVTIQSIGDGAPGLIDLFPIITMLLAENADLLGKITSIHESYYILDAPSILQGFSVDLFRAYTTVLSNSPPAVNMADMYRSISMLIQLAPSSLWGEPLHISGLFALLLKDLDDDKMSTILLTDHVYLFARIAMADRQMLLQLISATAAAQNMSEASLYNSLLDQWWSKFDNMSEPRHRKLTAMGIASLAATGRAEVLERLPTEIFNLWLDVFGEIKEAQNQANADGTSSPLTRFWDSDSPPTTYFNGTDGTPEYDRRKLMYDNDPVQATQLSSYVAALLREAESVCGSQAFQALYLQKADPLVLRQIQAELLR